MPTGRRLPPASTPRAQGAERFICLGDYVGYGADPEWTVDTVMALVDEGAVAVRGNHDNAIGTTAESMNAEAQAAIEWTHGRLSAAQRRFLAELPLTRRDDDRLYVHSEASNPSKWRYVQSTADAARSIQATTAHVTFCGHVHQPALYSMSAAAKMTNFVPSSDRIRRGEVDCRQDRDSAGEAVDPAAAILEFAAVNHVDHIVIGARQNSLVRSLLGSVSSKVAAEGPSTVTVVRPPRVASPIELEETSEKPDEARD